MQELNVSTTGTYPYLSLAEPVNFTQSILVINGFNISANYTSNIYSIKLYNASYNVSSYDHYYTEDPITIRVYSPDGYLIEQSDPFSMENYMMFDANETKLLNKYLDWTTCDMGGCS